MIPLIVGGCFIFRAPNGGSLAGLYIRHSGFTHEVAFTPLSINELLKIAGFRKVLVIPEPGISKNPLKNLLDRILRYFLGKVFSLDPKFVRSANIIGIGIKK